MQDGLTACIEQCGDGRDYYNYGCDDYNTDNGDGCDSNCNVEGAYICNGGNWDTKSCCYIFGNGLWECQDNPYNYEDCDDGNLINGDGCDD